VWLRGFALLVFSPLFHPRCSFAQREALSVSKANLSLQEVAIEEVEISASRIRQVTIAVIE
jgi:hypothetical protein